MTAFRFRHLPVTGELDNTQNFEQLQAIITDLEAKVADSGWVAPTLLNSWTNLGGANVNVGYRKQGNVVRFRGFVTGGVSGKELFALPAGFRPTGTIGPVGSGEGPGTASHFTITAAGAVTITSAGTVAGLDGVTFTVD